MARKETYNAMCAQLAAAQAEVERLKVRLTAADAVCDRVLKTLGYDGMGIPVTPIDHLLKLWMESKPRTALEAGK